MAEHYDTTVLPTRPAKPRDKGKIEGAVLIAERWIIARLRNRQFFDLAVLNAEIGHLLEVLNGKTMRHFGRSRRELFDEIERAALRRCRLPRSNTPNGRPPRFIPITTLPSTATSTRFRMV